MQVKDLAAEPPRRWTEELGGIRWLPRLIDKTRAALAGTLGDYLYGQSPVDRGLLRALGLRYRDFTAVVREAASDDAVLRELERSVPAGLLAARRWSRALRRTHWAFLFVIDLDDGYLGKPWALLRRPANCASASFARWLKRRFPSRAAEAAPRS